MSQLLPPQLSEGVAAVTFAPIRQRNMVPTTAPTPWQPSVTYGCVHLSGNECLQVCNEAAECLVVQAKLLTIPLEEANCGGACLVDIADGIADLLGNKALVQLCSRGRAGRGGEGRGRATCEQETINTRQ
jgi:hypothetical protein